MRLRPLLSQKKPGRAPPWPLSVRGRPEERASRRRTDPRGPSVSLRDGSEAWPLPPAVSATPVFFCLSRAPRFPSHKSLLLTRSLCTEVLRVRAPVGPSCQWLSGLQTFLRSKSVGRYIKPIFEAAAPAFFGEPGLLPTPQPRALSDPAF